MKSLKPSNINKGKIVDSRSDYSHVQSRLYSSLSKSKSRSKHQPQSPLKTVRHSMQKIRQIGQQKYKQAMKHMQLFNKYEQQKKKRNQTKNQIINSQCTFKPKINKDKKKSNLSYHSYSSLYSSTLTSLNGSKSSLLNNEGVRDKKPDIYSSAVFQKKKSINMGNILIQNQQTENSNNQQRVDKKFFKKPNRFDTGDRLINWGKTRDANVLQNAIQIQASRSNSRQSTYSDKLSNNSINSNLLSYKQLRMKKLNLTLSTIINQSQQHYYTNHNNKLSSLSITPKQLSRKLNSYAVKSSASLYYNSTTITPKGSSTNLDKKNYQSMKRSYLKNQAKHIKHINDQILQDLPSAKRKYSNFYTQINPELQQQTYGQRLLAKQSQRGEGSFYLRQAKANIMKNYNKTDVMIKDKKYQKKFSYFSLKEPVFN